MSSVEALYPTNYSTESSWVSFTMEDGTVRNKAMDLQPIYNEYPVFHGFTSAVTGQPVSALGRNEIIMSESMACKIFGDVNHIGSTVSFNVYGRDMDFMLADVYQDLSWTESLPAYIQFSIWDPGQYRVTDQYVIYYELLLRDGFTVEQFKEEADSRLKPMGLVTKVSRLEDSPVKTNNISMITRSLVWLIGSMILLVALISFLISAPLGVLINKAVIMMGDGYLEPASIPAWIPVGGACLFTMLFITLTVFGNIRRIMRLNPTDYIAKE